MNNDSQIAEEAGRVFALALPFMPFWYLLGSTGLKDTNLAWFIAVLVLLGFECGIMIMDWINPKRTSSDIPNGWFDRLAHAVARAGLVVYLAVAVVRADSGYLALLKTSVAHLNFSSSAVWVPCLIGAVLLANAAYAIPMGVRYRVGPNQRADRISAALGAVLWMAGAAARRGIAPASRRNRNASAAVGRLTTLEGRRCRRSGWVNAGTRKTAPRARPSMANPSPMPANAI